MKLLISLSLLLGLLTPIPAQAQSCGWDQKPGWVARENLRVGHSDWAKDVPLRLSADFSRRKKMPRIEGYLDATSIGCGSTTKLTIIGASSANIAIYRIGYYQGKGARLVATIKSARSITATSKTPPGQYLVKLTSPRRASTFIPLVIRSTKNVSDITFVSSVMTWQAYNQWGGYSLYKGSDGKSETKSQQVSFNRPYDGDGAGQFRYMEQPLVTLIEKLGIDTQYITDIDLDHASEISSQSIVFGGHSEYWTQQMRKQVEQAVASGVNLLIFGGNTAYAQTELQNRELIGRLPYRDLGNPESLLIGSQYFALGIKKDLESQNKWPFSVLGENAVIKGVYGYEADTAMGTKGPGVEILARATISPTEKGWVAMSTYYSAPSGASVLNMGTNGWVCAMENLCPWGHTFDTQTQNQIQAVTLAVLRAAHSGKWRVAQIEIPTRL
ncbi:MAG: hypothetical protein F2766_04955 [Actinobacteria bacterium]|uniref:Unannotated protein n=1 Tax=freshwater metagenome TaxID=449393 RepID=A0A6J7B0G8_9ZZZZ|nr:hypothetical protein [Actinomycetota bacterium]MSY36442.1 hypothetical protein [Actinomycetota bacterium]MTA72916.1 hypothetical protein [Actinomycetota bacterium]MTB29410.1 hypothetical protein [Actinomycetota bacterium]